MNKNLKIVIQVLIVVIPVIGVTIISMNKISDLKQKVIKQAVVLKDAEIQRHIEVKQKNAKIWADNIVSLFDLKYEETKGSAQKELQNTIDIAYLNAKSVYEKYSKTKSKTHITELIKSKLSEMKYDSTKTAIFLVDYQGNTLMGKNSQVDMDARTILLEEIQKVRRRGGGFITSRIDDIGTQRYILVKDLGINNLFIGTDIYIKANNESLKSLFIEIAKNTLLDSNDCVYISEGKRIIYTASSCSKDQKNEHIYSVHSKVLDINLSYTFDSAQKIELENQKFQDFKKLLD